MKKRHFDLSVNNILLSLGFSLILYAMLNIVICSLLKLSYPKWVGLTMFMAAFIFCLTENPDLQE